MGRIFTPVQVFVAVAVLGLALAFTAVVVATQQPWLGLDLAIAGDNDRVVVANSEGPSRDIPAGSQVLSVEGAGATATPITPDTLIEEPDQFGNFSVLDRFRADQDAIASALRSGAVRFTVVDLGETKDFIVIPDDRRPITDLPFIFWLQILVGLSGLFIGGWICSLAPGERPQAFVLLTGVGLAMASTSAAIYSTRELALPASYFRFLAPMNLAGALTFGAGAIGLFLSYPRRIGPRWLPWVQIGVLALWTVFAATRVINDAVVAFQLPIATAMLVLILIVVVQFWIARRDKDLPARAVLRLFGLSIVIGAGSFVMLITVPSLLGREVQLSQGWAFTLFLICYIGLALAVRRYRIFNLEIWSFRLLFFAGGALLLVGLDALLIYGLALDRAPALGVALFLVAFLYLPLRDALSRRIARRRGRQPLIHYFRDVSTIALTKDLAEQSDHWDSLLEAVFQPLAIVPGPPGARQARLEDEGIGLILPAIPPISSRRLKWAGSGRRLFSDEDLARAEELTVMLAQLIEGRAAYETGASEERARIARDIHDNIGIQLLSALHSTERNRKDVLIRETLADLREIIDNKTGPGLDLGNLIADLRVEVADVLEAAGLMTDWPLGVDLSGYNLSPRIAHTLRSVLREATNNALRHSGATRVSYVFSVDENRVRASVSDNGRGIGSGGAGEGGQGIANMKVRVAALGGIAMIDTPLDGQGTRITVELPLIKLTKDEGAALEASQ